MGVVSGGEQDDWIVPLESFAELVYSADSTREVKPLSVWYCALNLGRRLKTDRRFAGAC
jgi:hypothetical protein